jgi:hypothetical protein
MLSRASGTKRGIELRRDAGRSHRRPAGVSRRASTAFTRCRDCTLYRSKKTTSPSLNSFETTGRGNPAPGCAIACRSCAGHAVCPPRVALRAAHSQPGRTLDNAKASGSIACGQAGGAIAPAHRDRTQPALKAVRNTAAPPPTAAWAISDARIENPRAAVRSAGDGWVLPDQLAFLAWSKRSRTTFPASRKLLESLRI